MTVASDFLEPLRRLHDAIRSQVLAACEEKNAIELAHVAHEGKGDVTYEVDRISETALLDWFAREIAVHEPIVLIGEGLPNGRVVLPDKAAEASRLTAAFAGQSSATPQNVPIKNYIDEQIFGRMERDKVPHAPLANDYEFVRRAYLDATGLVPTPAQVREFVSSNDPNKRDKLIDSFADKPGKIKGELREILRVAAFEIVELERPLAIANAEASKLAKRIDPRGRLSGMITAILHMIDRDWPILDVAMQDGGAG